MRLKRLGRTHCIPSTRDMSMDGNEVPQAKAMPRVSVYVKRWRAKQEDWTLLSIDWTGSMVTERWLKHPRHTENNDKGDPGDQGDVGDSTDKGDNADKGDKTSDKGDNNDKNDNADKGDKTSALGLPSVIKAVVLGD